MSTATTFTMRDLSRETARVMAVAEKFGSVVVKSRTGVTFTIMMNAPAKPSKKSHKELIAEFRRVDAEREKRFREMGYIPPKPGEWDEERFNRIIAGEE